jgi:hypothetical protein
MTVPQEGFHSKDEASLMADVRDAMSRRGDFDPSAECYATETNRFEILAVLEALEMDGEVLA